MTTLHILLESEADKAMLPAEAGDLCIDLTMKQDAGSKFVKQHIGVRLLPCTWYERESLRPAIRAFSDWYATLGRTTQGNASLIDVCRLDSQLSLWWMTNLSNKDLGESGLFRIILLAHYLRSQAPELLREARGCDKLRVSMANAEDRRRFSALLAPLFHIEGSSEGTTEKLLNRVREWAGATTRIAEWAAVSKLNEQSAVRGNNRWHARFAEGDYVAVCTYDHEWLRAEDSTWASRYWADSPARLRASGLRVERVPTWTMPTTVPSVKRWMDLDEDAPIRTGLPVAPGSTRKALAIVRRMKSELCSTLTANQEAGLTVFCGLDLVPMLRSDLDEFVSRRGLLRIQQYLCLREFFREHPPTVALYRNEFLSHGRWIRAALPDSTTAIGLQHGLMLANHSVQAFDSSWLHPDLKMSDKPAAARAEFVPMPDRFACYSEPVKQTMTYWDYPGDRILPVGSLRHDQMFEIASAQETGAEDPTREVDEVRLLISGGVPSQSRRFIQLALEATQRSDKNIQLWFKPHPRFPMSRLFTSLAPHHDNLHRLSPLLPLENWLSSVDAMLVETSTTGLEALVYGVPLICVQRSDGTELYPFVEEGAAIGVRTPQELLEALETCTSAEFRETWEERRREFLRRHLSPSLGDACGALSSNLREPDRQGNA